MRISRYSWSKFLFISGQTGHLTMKNLLHYYMQFMKYFWWKCFLLIQSFLSDIFFTYLFPDVSSGTDGGAHKLELDAVVVSVDIATAVWRHVAVVNDCLAVESRPIRCIVNSAALDLYRWRKDGNIEIREITTLRLGRNMSHCPVMPCPVASCFTTLHAGFQWGWWPCCIVWTAAKIEMDSILATGQCDILWT